MYHIVDLAVLALYAPVIVCTGYALWLYVFRVLVPAARQHGMNVRDHALMAALVFALVGDLAENLYYGWARVGAIDYMAWTSRLPIVGLMKLFILAASLNAIAAYYYATQGRNPIHRLIVIAFVLWGTTFSVATYVTR